MPQQSHSMQKSNCSGQTCMELQTESSFFLDWIRYMDIPVKFLLPLNPFAFPSDFIPGQFQPILQPKNTPPDAAKTSKGFQRK